VAWKPAFGGRLVAAIHASSPMHLATVRPGVLPLLTPRATHRIPVTDVAVVPSRRVQVRAAGRDDDLDLLVAADRVVAVGTGVQPDEYPVLRPLLAALGAELAATRKVTDKGWLPRSRQVGITGRSIAPQLYVALGIHGKFNHVVGVRGAGTVLAVNCEPAAPIFDAADIGIVADWHDVVPLLTAELGARLASVASQ
jgi:electron transfer flavoprotein alpha subunit